MQVLDLLSPRQLGNIATSFLQDLSKVFPDLDPESNPDLIVSRQKIRSQQKCHFGELSNEDLPKTCAISWDGKKQINFK